MTLPRPLRRCADRRAGAGSRPGGSRPLFVGGGTPSLLDDALLARLLWPCRQAGRADVECNPETITSAKARGLVEGGVTRVSLGAQSFRPHLLETLERLATRNGSGSGLDAPRGGRHNLNLDLIFLGPRPVCIRPRGPTSTKVFDPAGLTTSAAYELEAKPGTRFTHRHGAELERQAEALDGALLRAGVVARLRAAGYRWYETANSACPGRESRHNLGYWLGHDYARHRRRRGRYALGLRRRRNLPSLPPLPGRGRGAAASLRRRSRS